MATIIKRKLLVSAPSRINELGQMIANNIKWHYAIAKEFHKIGLCGFKYWHKAEAETDKELLEQLESLLDTVFVIPESTEEAGEIFNIKTHFATWIENEKTLCSLIEEFLEEELSKEMRVFLDALYEEAEHEKEHVEEVLARLNFTNFLPLDLALSSAAINVYFKTVYEKDEPICFVIG